jgi:ABC-2 type transport system permease protein
MKIVAIVRTSLVRSFRDRLALFFSVLLPLILILVLGLTFGAGNSARVGVVNLDGGPLASDLVAALAAARGVPVEVRTYGSAADVEDAASRGVVSAAIVVPAGYTDALSAGRSSEVTVLVPPTQRASAVRTRIDEAIAAEVGIVRAAQWASSTTGQPFADALAAARARTATVAGVATVIVPVNAAATGVGGYGSGAQSMLVLFVFLTSLTGAVELVITRQLGIARRMFSTPTTARTIIGGESLSRIAFAIAQGLFIVAASALLFGVDWGDGAAVAVILVVYALVAGGASMVVGSFASTPSQAGALGAAIGMLLALVGGAMVPIEVFPAAMQTVARVTPHAWAIDALSAAVNTGAGVTEVLPQLAVLLAFAGLFFAIAVARLRRVLVGAA